MKRVTDDPMTQRPRELAAQEAARAKERFTTRIGAGALVLSRGSQVGRSQGR